MPNLAKNSPKIRILFCLMLTYYNWMSIWNVTKLIIYVDNWSNNQNILHNISNLWYWFPWQQNVWKCLISHISCFKMTVKWINFVTMATETQINQKCLFLSSVQCIYHIQWKLEKSNFLLWPTLGWSLQRIDVKSQTNNLQIKRLECIEWPS